MLHPSLMNLLRYQMAAKWRTVALQWRRPRRLALSILAVALGLAWLGQAIAGMLFRQPAPGDRLQIWIPAGLAAYAFWHLLKAATRAPIEPFEWSEAEREILGSAPLTRHQVVSYRLATILSAAGLKTTCFTFIMLPDLTVWWLGLLGMLLALLFLDLWRLIVEVFVWGLTRAQFVRYRIAVLSVAVTAVSSGIIVAWTGPPSSSRHDNFTWGMMLRASQALLDLRETIPGRCCELPFRVFSRVILARGPSLAVAVSLLACGAMVLTAVAWLLHLDRLCQLRTVVRERRAFTARRWARAPGGDMASGAESSAPRLGWSRCSLIPPHLRGVGPLAWRQLLGILHYPGPVLISLLLPGGLSLIALFTPASDVSMVIQIVGSLIFYSFLLLPAALRFDFRRDADRLAVLRALPIPPWAATLGQLLAPVAVCTLFQLAILAIAWCVRPFPPAYLVISTVLLLPVNWLIFALENLIFLWFPYRPQEEGMTVFLRSILTFTAKSLLFLLGVGITLLWVSGAHLLTHLIPWGDPQWRLGTIFTAGMWIITSGTSLALLASIARAYARFDPSQDVPAMS